MDDFLSYFNDIIGERIPERYLQPLVVQLTRFMGCLNKDG